MSSPASRATPVPERDDQLLSVGKKCSHPSCHLVDYLPFKCQHCTQLYCQEHFKVEAHQCPEYDESKHDRVAPNCPLCNTPVAVRPNQDPNVRMEEHFTKECSVMTGRSTKANASPRCARAKCGKILFSPIRCTQCRAQFCPSHRFPADHSCPSLSAPTASGSRPPARAAAASSFAALASNAKNLNTKATQAGAAIKKSLASTSPPAPAPMSKLNSAPATSTATTSKSSTPNLFSKADRGLSSSINLANDAIAHATSMTETNTPNNTQSTNNSAEPKPKSIRATKNPFLPPPVFAF
ncbi:hypothetical protein BDQ17DRAFT_1296767 [Cyathus striatus]|nr:hypothetical protein BDQ17DRAFT_1296767 [Cyathus striatus]